MDLNAIETFARLAHAKQRYGDEPYGVHLESVVRVLTEEGVVDEEVLAAGWLHDVLEDTPVLLEELVALAGQRVASIVDAVTDGKGTNRRERKLRPYELAPRTPGAILVKLADRIANVEGTADTRRLRMYREEHVEFRRRLHRPGEADELWARLERALRA